MYSKRKGKSGSIRPAVLKTPEWVKISKEDCENLIVKFAKEGKSMAEIGLILRDQYAVPLVKLVLGCKIKDVIEKHQLLPKLPEDIAALAKKALRIRKHLEENKKDKDSWKGLRRTESRIMMLIKYYKNTGALPLKFKYKPDEIKLLLR